MAAKDGKVTFSGSMRGYGNVVVIKHSGAFTLSMPIIKEIT
jgi:murein DD-endopeptidase MepM/ murein hydrolase activator NlpD